MKKLILIVITLVVVFSGFYFLSKNGGGDGSGQIPKDWLAYDTATVKLMYPPDWELRKLAGKSANSNFSLEKKDTTQPKIQVYTEEMAATYWISFSLEDNPEEMSAKDYYFGQFAGLKEFDIVEVEYGGISGVKYPEGTAPASGPSTMVLLAKGTKFYRFTYAALATKETHEKFLSTFETMLSTLEVK